MTSEKNGKKTAKEPDDPLLRHLQLADIFAEFCATQLLDTLNIKKVERIRSLFDEGEKIHILLQHDPDPDAIGSALALRELLGRNRTTTPIVTFGYGDPAGELGDDRIVGNSNRSNHPRRSTQRRRASSHGRRPAALL